MNHLDISLLGTVQINRDGGAVPVRAKVTGLLAFLAVESDRPHQRAALATLFWPEEPEAKARHNLRQALASLRQSISDPGAAAPYLLSTRATVAFNDASDYTLDVREFVRLLDTCDRHDHRRRDRCATCLARLEQAVTLYRGDFLHGFSPGDSAEFENWTRIWRQRLRDRMLRALVSIASWHELQDDPEHAIPVLQRSLELDAWNEETHRRLMRLYAGQDQRSAALAQYERCRVTLDAELGIEPDESTRALHERIRRAAAPRYETTRHSRLRQHFEHVPAQFTTLVGRQQELEEIADLLDDRDCRLLTLLGPGGIGKTRLAMQLASEHARYLADTAAFVLLGSVRDRDGIVHTIASSLGLSPSMRQRPEQQLCDWLRGRSLFLVLDNAEHLVEELPLLNDLLSASPQLKLLVTSRQRLDLRGEWIYEVGGLRYPQGDDTDRYEGYGAVELLGDRLRQVRSGGAVRHEERPSIIRISRLAGGMPLALELAAAWASILTTEQIADEMQRSLDFLSSSLRDLPDRHRSMRAVFQQSQEMLTDDAQSAYRQLSVFENGFELAAAEAVTGAGATVLAELTAKSLLIHDAHGRYWLHPLLQQFGRELLRRDARTHRDLRDRHSHYYLELLARSEHVLTGPDQRAALAVIETEIDNVRSAWRRAVEQGMVDAIGDAARGLWFFYVNRGWMREGASTFGETADALEQLGPLPPSDAHAWRHALAISFVDHGGFLSGLGHYDDGIARIERGIGMLQSLERKRELGLALNMLATAYHMKGALDRSHALLEESLEHFRTIGDAWGIAFSLNDLGLVSYLLGDQPDADRYCEESLGMFRQIGDRRGHAFAAYNLGMIAARRGDYPQARRRYRESLAMREDTDDRWGTAISLVQLGSVERLMGAREESRSILRRALGIAWDNSVMPVVLDALVELTVLDIETGQMERARTTLAAVARHPAQHGDLRERVAKLTRDAGAGAAEAVPGASDNRAVDTVNDLVRSLVG